MHEHTGSPFVRALLCMLLTTSSASGQVTIDTTARFAVIGVFGVGLNKHEGKVAALVRSWNPEFIITLGDNRYGAIDYDSAVGQHFCEFLAETETGGYCSGNDARSNAFFPSLGNHDYTDGDGLDEYLGYFTLPGLGLDAGNASGNERFYDFIKGPVHFFVIDSYGASGVQPIKSLLKWLGCRLNLRPPPLGRLFIFIIHHIPPGSTAPPRKCSGLSCWGADAGTCLVTIITTSAFPCMVLTISSMALVVGANANSKNRYLAAWYDTATISAPCL